VTLTDTTRLAPAADAWAVVLGRTPRGDAELGRPLFPLSTAQRTLLQALDGQCSLRELTAAHPTLASVRLSRDAARLLAFGLVKQLRGELPREIVVASMNLTMRVPAEAFRHLAARAPAPAVSADPPLAGASALRLWAVAALTVTALAVAALAVTSFSWPR
jgi:hypothetical protein